MTGLKKIGRPAKNPIRNHQIRFGRISDDLQRVMSQFDSQNDKQLIEDLLESLKPKKNAAFSRKRLTNIKNKKITNSQLVI